MGFLMGGSNANTSRSTALMVNSSSQGNVIPLVFGHRRIPINLIWYGNFQSHPQKSGGKGGLGGGKSGGGSYTYSASFAAALCEGPITSVTAIWRDKAKQLVAASTPTGSFQSNTVFVTVPVLSGKINPVTSGQTFIANLGVTRGGVALIPNRGTNSYTVNSNGGYSFTSDLWGANVNITYYYSTSDTASVTGFVFFTGTFTQAQWNYLVSNYPENAFYYRELAYLGAIDYDLGGSSALPNINAEVVALCASTVPGYIDATPADVANFILTDGLRGVNFPPALLGTLNVWRNYTIAQLLLVSPSYDSQQDAASILEDLATYSNSAWAIVNGLLEVVPYGDQAITANGATYTPPAAPEYDLDDDTFVYEDGEDPVTLVRARKSDQFNSVQMQFNNRTMDYARDIAQAKDQASIDRFGEYPMPAQTGDLFCDPNIAQTAVQLLLQRQMIPNTYKFRLGFQYIDLDVMDIVSINDARLGLVQQWVRITDIEEDDLGTLSFTVEEYSAGTGTPALYSYDLTNGLLPNFEVDPGPNNSPVFFEPPISVSQSGKMEICIALSGQGELWAGADCYASFDGATYVNMGRIEQPSRHGLLFASLSNVADPDLTSQLQVALADYQGAMLSGSQSDADQFTTLCWLDGGLGELVSYETATLLSPVTSVGGVPMFGNSYALTYLRRGIYATDPGAHPVSTNFVRLDDDIFRVPITAQQIGSQISVKFLPYNIYGGGQPTLEAVAAYHYTISGNGWLYAPDDVSGLSFTADNAMHWTGVDDTYRPIDYEVRIGATFAAATVVGFTPLPTFAITVSGTYWVRAHSRSPQGVDVYSENPQSLAVVYTGLAPFVVNAFDQVAESWPGTVAGGCSISGATLILDPTVAQSGSYTFRTADTTTLPSVQAAYINFAYTQSGASLVTDVFALSDFFSPPDLFGTAPGASVTFTPQIALSQNGTTFAAYQDWKPGGVYIFKAVRFRVLLSTVSTTTQIIVSALSAVVSVAQRVDSYSVTTNSGGPAVTITYNNPGPFISGPTLSGTILNAQAGDLLVIVPGGTPANTCTVDVKNAGASVARTVHVNAVGN